MTDYSTLRAGNEARHAIWMKGDNVGLLWRATELAGEVGEVNDLLAYIPSEARDFWIEKLGEELADSFICIDLLLMDLQVPPLPWDPEGIQRLEAPAELGNLLGKHLGGVCNNIKKIERELRGYAGSRATPEQVLSSVRQLAHILHALAFRYGIDPQAVTEAKFNATSDKVGLPVHLALS